MNTHITQRISDLEALAMEAGIELPYPPEMIARLEETGAIVPAQSCQGRRFLFPEERGIGNGWNHKLGG